MFFFCPRCAAGAGPPAPGLGLGVQEAAGTPVHRHGPEACYVPGRQAAGAQRGAGRGAAPRLPAEGGETSQEEGPRSLWRTRLTEKGLT